VVVGRTSIASSTPPPPCSGWQVLLVDAADLVEQRHLLVVVGGRHQAALGVDHGLPVVLLGLQRHHRLQRLAVGRIDLQRLLEHVERLLALTQVLPNHAHPVVDAHHLALGLRVAVLHQDGLVDLPGPVPVLHLEQQVGPADQRRQVGRVDVVGRLVVAQRAVVVAQLVGGARRPVVQLVQLARVRAGSGRPCAPASR
jgi:hypothetical protein